MTTTAPFRRVSRSQPCPICEHADWCRTFPDGGIECMRIESATATRNDGWLHWTDGRRPADWQDRIAALPAPEPPRQYDPDLLDRVYRAALARMPLSERHRDDLRRKGFADAQIVALGHGTLPATARARQALAAAVQVDLGIDLVGTVPGFFHGPTGPTLAAVDDDSGRRVIPVRDRAGRIVGLRCRVDDADRNKYRWISGSHDGGTGIDGNTVHWAIPGRARPITTIGITEGEDKANLACACLGYPILSLPGIASQGHLVAALAELPDLTHVVVFFDKEASPETQAIVTRAEQRLVDRLAAARPELVVLQARWHPDDGKGIDDVLLRGLVPITPNHPLAPGADPASGTAVDPVADPEQVRVLRERIHRLDTREAIRKNASLGASRHYLAPVAQVLADLRGAPADARGYRLHHYSLADEAGCDAKTMLDHLRRVSGGTTNRIALPDPVCERYGLEPGTPLLTLTTETVSDGPDVADRHVEVYVQPHVPLAEIPALLATADFVAPRQGGVRRTYRHERRLDVMDTAYDGVKAVGSKKRRSIPLPQDVPMVTVIDTNGVLVAEIHTRPEAIGPDFPMVTEAQYQVGIEPEDMIWTDAVEEDHSLPGRTSNLETPVLEEPVDGQCLLGIESADELAARRAARERVNLQEARRLLAILRQRGLVTELDAGDRLRIPREDQMGDRLAGRVWERRVEIADLLALERDRLAHLA